MRRLGWTVALVVTGMVAGCGRGDKEGAPSPTPSAVSDMEPTPLYYPFDATPLPGFEAAELTSVEEALASEGAASVPDQGTAETETEKVSTQQAKGAAPSASSGTTATGSDAMAQATWTPTQAEMEQALADYGTWQDVPDYGRVWIPSGMADDWRPYRAGRWVNTPYGWLWEAAEPWGWLPYHYGHWVFVPRYGWVWVPGRVWVPAQVAWRASDAYVAWAPLPPGRVAIETIRPAAWVVVPVARFLDFTLARYVLPPARVAPLLPGMRILTTTRAVGRTTVYHVGPTVTVVRRWVPRVPPAVSIHVWRARVPVRYIAHYQRGRAQGWYHRPLPARGVHVETGTRRRGTEVDIHRSPGRGRSVEVEHHNPRRKVEVQVDHRGRHRTVEIDRRGPRRDVQIERRGRRVRVDVDH